MPKNEPESPFDRKSIPVGEVASRVRRLVEGGMGKVWVSGECSNVSRPNSGHLYFSLKDSSGLLNAAWFKSKQGPGSPPIEDGLQLNAYGLITVYESGARVQILVEELEVAGRGDLQAAFEKLKKKLSAEGLFDPARKHPLPLLPQRIGIVTSPTGAALRDILNVLQRRFPDREILLAPVKAQGQGSARGIAAALEWFNANHAVDVIILGRGGGSIEDLWSFNEERVARAVSESSIPVISAVGHETDFTISDFVADLRAPTPSAAAELVIGRKTDFETQISGLERRLRHSLERRILQIRERLSRATRTPTFQDPRRIIDHRRAQVQELENRMREAFRETTHPVRLRVEQMPLRMHHALQTRIRDAERKIDELAMGKEREIKQFLDFRRSNVDAVNRQLTLLNPYSVLDRGFSITRAADGGVVENVEKLQVGDTLETLTRSGIVLSTVEENRRNADNEHEAKK